MKCPPLWLRMSFHNNNKNRGFSLWLPLFLLLPLSLVVLLILSPLILIALLILWPSGWAKRALLMLRASYGLYFSMRGLRVDIQNSNECIHISVA